MASCTRSFIWVKCPNCGSFLNSLHSANNVNMSCNYEEVPYYNQYQYQPVHFFKVAKFSVSFETSSWDSKYKAKFS